jgi:C1A family cysteine protease
MIIQRKFTWKKDTEDTRDYIYRSLSPPLAKRPTKVDLRPLDGPIEDQGDLGSCTANAIAGNLQFIEKKDKLPVDMFSRLFIYYGERLIEGTVSEDSGSTLRDGIKTLAANGACHESTWPYDPSRFTEVPPQAAFDEAMNHRISQYLRLLSLDDMKNCIATGYPFVFWFQVYQAFESPKVAKTGIVSFPKKGEQCIGGHAVMALGYNDSTGRFIVRNSWGTDWGQKGYFELPYSFFSKGLADDFWTIRRGSNI